MCYILFIHTVFNFVLSLLSFNLTKYDLKIVLGKLYFSVWMQHKHCWRVLCISETRCGSDCFYHFCNIDFFARAFGKGRPRVICYVMLCDAYAQTASNVLPHVFYYWISADTISSGMYIRKFSGQAMVALRSLSMPVLGHLHQGRRQVHMGLLRAFQGKKTLRSCECSTTGKDRTTWKTARGFAINIVRVSMISSDLLIKSK